MPILQESLKVALIVATKKTNSPMFGGGWLNIL
jgi:hypothetical protein